MECGLPDPYNGGGDGIGSCECPRCECCGGAPDDDCRCNQSWEDVSYLYDGDEPTDYLRNDPECDHLKLRLERAATS